MKYLLRSLLIALIPACPLIFSSCETSEAHTQGTDGKPAVEHPHDCDEKPGVPHNHSDDEKADANKTVTNFFKVDGLTCIDCKNRLETSLKNHPGIISASVNHEIEPTKINTTVKHHPDVKKEDIIKIIKESGFQIEI